jgi:hypothetical protein
MIYFMLPASLSMLSRSSTTVLPLATADDGGITPCVQMAARAVFFARDRNKRTWN